MIILKIGVLLRQTDTNSLFRKALLKISAIEGEELYLCSGTLTQITKDPIFLNHVSKGFKGMTDPKIITLGMRAGKGECLHGVPIGSCLRTRTGYCNACKYQLFVNDLRAHGSSPASASLYTVEAFREIQDKWHAKIAIKVKDGEPIAAIVGSSNLTIPAYAEKCSCSSSASSCSLHSWSKATRTFPFECDVLFWDDAKLKSFSTSTTNVEGQSVAFEDSEIIVANPERDVKSDISKQLKAIKDLIADDKKVNEI